MEPVSIGVFDYINTWPVNYDLLPDDQVARGTPSELTRKLEAGELAVSSFSSGRYPFIQDKVKVLPSFVLANTGKVGSVILMSRPAIGKLHGQTIYTTKASETSIILLKILLHHLKIEAKLEPSSNVAAEWEKGNPALFIGDEALKLAYVEAGKIQTLYKYTGNFINDLGSLWFDITGMPFVWALWGVHVNHQQYVAEILKKLEASRAHGLENMPRLVEEASKRLGIPAAYLETYLRKFDYFLKPEHLESLKLFYAKAHELNLMPPCSSIHFLEEPIKTVS